MAAGSLASSPTFMGSVCAAVKPLAIMLCADRVRPNRKHAFKDALTQAGSPDNRGQERDFAVRGSVLVMSSIMTRAC
jgi:hypothetical protein